MKNEIIAVVGATGKTGVRIFTKLQQLGYMTRGLSRNSEIAFDWSDRATWGPALEGVSSAYVTYFPDLAVPQAERDMRDFTELAVAQGVKHLVLLSGRGEEGAERAENVVRTSGLEWNIVRASWFMQNFSESFMLDGLQGGELFLPEPKADEPFIDVDDIADVAVAALTRLDLRNQLLEVTGPEVLSFANCVGTIARISDRDIGFQVLPVEAYLAAAKAEGLPDDIAWLMNELFVNVLDGRNEWTTDTVEQVLGRPARSFQHYVENTAKTGVWAAVGE
ncbi:MAG: NAD(P)H-binding protein [Gammaproteobacteria bacterium]|nr:NAD(P)H-binding protein [Gammaproteobacteria bacterium]